MWTVQAWYDKAAKRGKDNATFCRDMGEHYFELYQRNMPGQSRRQITDTLARFNAERLAAVPDLSVYPELRGMDQLVDAQWRGLRDGANLDDAQHEATCAGITYYHRYLVNQTHQHTANCSAAFFIDSDRGPLIASNLDTTPDQPFGVPEWPAPNEHLVVKGVSSGVYCDEASPELFPAPVDQLVARYCCNTEQAAAVYERYNHFWGPGNLLIADRNGDIAVIEKSSCRIGIRRIEGGFGFVTAMTAHEPNFRAFLHQRRAASLEARGLPTPCADTAYWDAADNRHHLMTELMEDAKREPTVEKLRAIMQYRDEKRGCVAVGGETLFPGGQPCEHTLRTSIHVLREGKILWWARQGDSPSWENRMPDATVDDAWLW